MKVQNKVIAVTGGGNGMGREVVLNLLSRGARVAAVEGLHSELLTTNVRVTVIFPGAIGTNLAPNSGVEISQSAVAPGDRRRPIKPLEPGKAVEIIVDAIERDRYRVMVGSDVTFLDRFYRLGPESAASFIFRQMKSLLPEKTQA
jgi:short-subunit dehydrogenase